MLNFFENNSSRLPKWCNDGDTVKLPYCQILGKYRMELPSYNTMEGEGLLTYSQLVPFFSFMLYWCSLRSYNLSSYRLPLAYVFPFMQACKT